jgi:hypothetical protein
MPLHYAPSFRRRLLAVPFVFLLTLTSCFEPPIKEDLLLRFLLNGAVVATSTVEIAADPDAKNPALARRLAERRREILEGSDPWDERFAAARPAAERFGWEKRLGELQTASRSAVITEPEGLAAFFGDTAIGASYTIDAGRGTAELSLYPGPAARATRGQRQEMRKTLAAWSAAIAEYLQAAGDLFSYLERQPDRARTCFGALFSDVMDKQELERLGEPTDEETPILERLNEAMQHVTDVLLVPARAEYSPDEISHLVYDPFPARLTVKLPGPPLELEGFQRGQGEALEVAGLGLWDALRSLEGRWLAPDPALFYVASERRGQDAKIDLDAFASRPRRAAPQLPSADEVRAAIEERLKPAPVYRASWQVQPDDETEFHWESGEGWR